MKPVLTEADFIRAAAAIGCSIAAVKAVCAVEAPRGGFSPSGEPTICLSAISSAPAQVVDSTRRRRTSATRRAASTWAARPNMDACSAHPRAPAVRQEFTGCSRAFDLAPT